jgi:hypothetical protein
MSAQTPKYERSAETSDTRAVLIGTMNYPVCSEDCGREMIAANPQHACTTRRVVIREDRPMCSWCMKPIAVGDCQGDVSTVSASPAVWGVSSSSPATS